MGVTINIAKTTMLILYLFILGCSILVLLHIFKTASEEESVDVSEKSTENSKRTYFENANIVTCNRSDNTCVAIFKNPLDRKTHYYRTRLRGDINEGGCPIQFRNIAATLRLWGLSWQNISSIKIFELNFECFALSSKWVTRLNDQKEDCQTKFGCRVEFRDFSSMAAAEKKTMSDLSSKVLENCISEDDLQYFSLHDDTSLVQKHFFEL